MRCKTRHLRKPGAFLPSIASSFVSAAVMAAGVTMGLSVPRIAQSQVYSAILQFPGLPNSGPSGSGNPYNGELLGIAANSSNVYQAVHLDPSASGTAPIYNTVQIYTLAGQNIGSFGGNGSGSGQFSQSSFPAGIAANSANVYVADPGNNRIQVFDTAGNYVSQFSAGNLTNLLAANSSSLYALDAQTDKVRVFDKNGNFVSQFGGQGNGAGQFGSAAPFGPSGPVGLAAADNRVYVSDQVNHRVEIFDSGGTYLSQFTGPTFNNSPYSPGSVATNGANVFVGEGNLIEIFDMNGNYQSLFGAVELGDFATSGTKVYTQNVLGRSVILFDVPEPGSVALLCGLVMGGANWLRRRMRHKRNFLPA